MSRNTTDEAIEHSTLGTNVHLRNPARNDVLARREAIGS